MARAALTTLLLFLPIFAGAGPVELPRPIDPLTQPSPVLAVDLAATGRSVSPLEGLDRLTPTLRARRSAPAPDEPVAVIVTLDEAALAHLIVPGPRANQTRLAIVGALEHDFVRRARDLGFRPGRGLSQFAIVTGQVPAGRLAEVAALPWVRGIQEQRTYQGQRVEGGTLINASRLRSELNGTGAGVGVAVVDSGIDVSHPELFGRVVAGTDTTGTTGTGFIDDNGHGTAVAGIIAGNDAGIAPQARLWAIKVLRADGSGTDEDLLEALDGLLFDKDVFGGLHLINLSIGNEALFSVPCNSVSPAYDTIFQALHDAGIALFAGSGNQGSSTAVAHPSCVPGATAVGAVYDADVGPQTFANCQDATTAADQIGCFSNGGPPLDLLAPAYCARTTAAGGGYLDCFGGTSAATAYATGVAAQILSLRRETTPPQLALAMSASGKPITDPRNGRIRNRLDALAAYELAQTGCLPDATTLCIDDQPGDRRFKVQVAYETVQGGGAAGNGRVVPLAELGVTRGGLFWFFNPVNPEMLVKVLNACVEPFQRYWVFFSAGTNVGLTVTVTDTVAHRTKVYTNADLDPALPVQDTDGFPCAGAIRAEIAS